MMRIGKNDCMDELTDCEECAVRSRQTPCEARRCRWEVEARDRQFRRQVSLIYGEENE